MEKPRSRRKLEDDNDDNGNNDYKDKNDNSAKYDGKFGLLKRGPIAC